MRLRHGQLGNTAGYTIDQTILIVAIIAILVTLIIMTVGWNLISKSVGAKLASHLRQVEDANGQFYAEYRLWPYESYTNPITPDNSMKALLGNNTANGITFTQLMQNLQSSRGGTKNFLSGYNTDPITGSVIQSISSVTVGSGVMDNPYGLQGKYITVGFMAVPFKEVKEAERVIDGETNMNFSSGRLVAARTTSDCMGSTPTDVDSNTSDSTLVNVCYAANQIK